MYSSLLSLTSALEGGVWSTPRPGHFTPGKDPVPIVHEAGWAPGPVWMGAGNLAPAGIRSADRSVRSGSLYRLDIFLFFEVSRSALGPTSPCISWVPGSFPWRELNHSPPSRAEVKNEWRYTYTPPSSLHFTFVPFRTARRATKTWFYILRDISSKTVCYKLAKNATREQDFLLLLTLESRFRRWQIRSNAGFYDKVARIAFFESRNMNISWITQYSELWQQGQHFSCLGSLSGCWDGTVCFILHFLKPHFPLKHSRPIFCIPSCLPRVQSTHLILYIM